MNPLLVCLSGSGETIYDDIRRSLKSSVSELRAAGWTDADIRELIHSVYRRSMAKRGYPYLGSATAAALITAISGGLAAVAGGVAAVVNMVRSGKATKDAAKARAAQEATAAEAAANNAKLAKGALIVGGAVAGVLVLSRRREAKT